MTASSALEMGFGMPGSGKEDWQPETKECGGGPRRQSRDPRQVSEVTFRPSGR